LAGQLGRIEFRSSPLRVDFAAAFGFVSEGLAVLRWVSAAPGSMPTRKAYVRARSTRHGNSAQQLELRARQHRSQLTVSEQRLWSAVHRAQLGACSRRQVPLGARFIADFVAPAARLVIEVGGAYHSRRERADAARDRKLARLGLPGVAD
jgi:very-short-patch-repair endonuclease